jgi:DNA-binding MarR family transcriptional regulator
VSSEDVPRGRQPPKLLEALRRAGREHSDATVLFHATVADRLGLNPTDHKAMSLLERVGPLSAGEIAERTGLATASVTALVDRLERRGFVRRVRDPADRRRVIVEPSAEAVDRIAPLFESSRRTLARLLSSYTPEQLEVILDFLTRSTERLRGETAKLASDASGSGTASPPPGSN